MKKSILLLLLPFLVFSQVGINTTTPTATLHVNGNLKIKASNGLGSDSILVIRDKEVFKIAASSVTSGQCPNFLKSQSSGYHIKFSSPASVPNPNNALNIQGKNFNAAGSSIYNNTYFYSWSNTTGQAININNMTVNFSGLICNYQ